MRLNKIKISINGNELDLDDIVEANEGEPLDVLDILEAVKYELESVAGETFENITIRDTNYPGLP